MKSVYSKDLQKNLLLQSEVFLIITCEKAQDKNGKEYFKLTLGDKTGKVDGKIWSENAQKADKKLLKAGSLIAVSGKVDEYRGNFQLNIIDVEPVDESAIEEFMESSDFDPDEMMKELEVEVKGISNKDLKGVLQKIIEDDEVARKLKYWPAANSIHHGFRSGMLQHILEMISISKGLRKYYPMVNYDILTAGIILHDIGKLEELGQSPTGSQYSKKGTLVGHITIGVLLFHDFAKNRLPEDIYLHILHLILSHHGSLEFGSPVFPATIEAIMLTYIDNLSSKARAAENIIKRIPAGEEFSDFTRWLNNVKLWNGGEFGVRTTSNEKIDLPDGTSTGVLEQGNEQLGF